MSNTWTYTLQRGHDEDPSGGACAMDAINWLVHGEHGDQPECACPVIGRYVIGLNDAMPDDERQRLLPYLHRIAGSRSPAHVQVRAEILARGAVRVLAPVALDAVGLTAAAWAAETAEKAAQATAWAGAAWVVMSAAWAAETAARAAKTAGPFVWDAALTLLDESLSAGPQGEPWSAVQVDAGMAAYRAAGGRVTA